MPSVSGKRVDPRVFRRASLEFPAENAIFGSCDADSRTRDVVHKPPCEVDAQTPHLGAAGISAGRFTKIDPRSAALGARLPEIQDCPDLLLTRLRCEVWPSEYP